MAEILPLAEAVRAEGADNAAAVVLAFSKPLPCPNEINEFWAYFERFADAKVV
jgi:hypothetical protein